jgi:hypothetical protein
MINSASFKREGPKIIHEAYYKKERGCLTLFFREKLLKWTSSTDPNNTVTISTPCIVEVKKAHKDKNQTELLFVKPSGSSQGMAFSFDGGKYLFIFQKKK